MHEMIQAVGRLLEYPSDVTLAMPNGKAGTDAEGPHPMEVDMSLTGSAQVTYATHIPSSLFGSYS